MLFCCVVKAVKITEKFVDKRERYLGRNSRTAFRDKLHWIRSDGNVDDGSVFSYTKYSETVDAGKKK